MKNTTNTLQQAVQQIVSNNPHFKVKDILAVLLDTNHPLASGLDLSKVYYQTVRSALLKVSGTKVSSSKKVSKASVILDLTLPPINDRAIKGKVYFKGK
jgi:hypothetical protein